MLSIALLSSLGFFICYGGGWMFGQCMCDRPIVVGPVVGLLLGDPIAGLMIGAALEAIYMGAVNIGGSISSDPTTATTFAVAFAVASGISTDAATALAIPIGVIGAFAFMFLNNVVFNIWVPFIDKFAEEGKISALVRLNWFTWFVRCLVPTLTIFAGVYLGAGFVQAFIEGIPDVVMRGLSAAGGLMPAVGLAILMKMLWSKEIAAYYLLGFILVIYLKLPLVAVAAIGGVIIVITALRDIDIKKAATRSAVAAVESDSVEDVEDFLS